MGNQNSQSGGPRLKLKRNSGDSTASSGSTKKVLGAMMNGGSKRGSVARSASAADIQERPMSMLQPTEKLAKFLLQKSQQLDNKNGITMRVFQSILFPRYVDLGNRLYIYFLTKAGATNKNYLTTSAFKQQCDKLFAILDDDAIRDYLVKMFSDEMDGQYTITPEGMRNLLMCAYHVAMDHYSEGPQMCLSISKTLKAVVDSCFHRKDVLSSQYVSHWLGTHAPRLLLPMHRYPVHILATAYRTIESEGPTLAAGLELTTPVLEQPPSNTENLQHSHPYMLSMSMSWLLAGALPPLYSRPQKPHSPSGSGSGLANINFLTKLFCSIPSHWINLYDSNEMGLGANRFQHHVMAYKGATLCLLKADCGAVFCVGVPCEWKESHCFWGGEESCLFQLLPTFSLLEKGSKMLYLNTAVRGYPMGLRIGTDPRAPIITVDGGFEKIEFKKIPYTLDSIEVWGCGDQQSREVQLDIKKWQVKEAERQRCVKLSAADWLDHPDRYLLELAGRPNYHTEKQN